MHRGALPFAVHDGHEDGRRRDAENSFVTLFQIGLLLRPVWGASEVSTIASSCCSHLRSFSIRGFLKSCKIPISNHQPTVWNPIHWCVVALQPFLGLPRSSPLSHCGTCRQYEVVKNESAHCRETNEDQYISRGQGFCTPRPEKLPEVRG